ncbi:unnamed protein product [Orchesella dallaii]|uniref:Uncharacterized protein n=1 Tax=Orchesella dallaii TaxID=48710 RepID=A0ABP1PRG0_9HEXA
MSSFRIYRALPVDVYQRLIANQVTNTAVIERNKGEEETNSQVNAMHGNGIPSTGTDLIKQHAQVLPFLPQKQKERAIKILQLLEKSGLAWNEKYEILDNGHRISNTNIVDLLNFLTSSIQCSKINLTALSLVIQKLKQQNVPLSVVSKAARLMITQGYDEVDNNCNWKTVENFKLLK